MIRFSLGFICGALAMYHFHDLMLQILGTLL
jgi:hypothetical protein